MVKVLVNGGCCFIGSAVIRHLIVDKRYPVVNVDRLTYAGSQHSLGDVAASPLYVFEGSRY
jgi:dTDP-glucose 4,6-dehydratase